MALVVDHDSRHWFVRLFYYSQNPGARGPWKVWSLGPARWLVRHCWWAYIMFERTIVQVKYSVCTPWAIKVSFLFTTIHVTSAFLGWFLYFVPVETGINTLQKSLQNLPLHLNCVSTPGKTKNDIKAHFVVRSACDRTGCSNFHRKSSSVRLLQFLVSNLLQLVS